MTLSAEKRTLDPAAELRWKLGLVAEARSMTRVLDLCERIAPTRSTVLLTGETGVGKELIARYIHRLSARRDHPIVVFHCAACPETLLESELFGHERGAFTGATQPRAGLFERANGGTLLLDEVGDIAAAAQGKLLRVLQERVFSRLGGSATYESDARFIATTHHDLLKLARHGKFREDLFYRLNVFPIHVPPLRERREDIAPLVRHFMDSIARHQRGKHGGVTEEAMAILVSYHWPGNIRQLHAVIERAMLLAEGAAINEKHLPPDVCAGFVAPRNGETASTLAYCQRLMVSRALFESNWDMGRAARDLGVSPHVLRQMAARLGVKRHVDGERASA